MADPNQDTLSPEDAQALVHAQQQLYSAGDPRAAKLYNYIVSAGYATKDAQGGLQVKGAAPQSQPGFFENLGHSLGIGSEEAQARQQALTQHPVRSALEAAGGPAVQAAKGLYGEFMRSTGELGQAADALQAGNPASAAVHGVTAVPLVGPALNKMADQAPPVKPGQSYGSQVMNAATPGNVGTAVGTAAQVAPALLGAADAAAPERAMIPNPPLVQAGVNAAESLTTRAKNIMAGPPDVQLTKALQPNKNNATWNADVKPGMQQIKSAEAQLGKPIEGFDDAAQAANLALKNIWGQVDARLSRVGAQGATIDGNQIADAMVNSVDKRMALQNPGVVDRVKAIADTYRRPLTTAEAEDFIQSNNAELTGYYARNKVSQQAAKADPETNAKIVEGDALRDALYSKIDDLTGPGVAQLKRAYGAVRNIQNNLVTQQMVYARKAPASLGEQLSYFQAAGKAITGDLVGAAKDVAVRRFLSDLNDKSSMITRAFQNTQPAQPLPMPTLPRFAGLLERGPIQMGAPADAPGAPPFRPPPYNATTRAQRLGLLLPQEAGGKIPLPYYPEMSGGERIAALMQLLRQNPQLALPAKASAIPLPPSF